VSHGIGRKGRSGYDLPGGLVFTPVEHHLIARDELADLTACSSTLTNPVHMACKECDTGTSRDGWGVFMPTDVIDIWGEMVSAPMVGLSAKIGTEMEMVATSLRTVGF
jgi:hypothetical protein